MDDVARAAGVSRQGLYLSFSNKEELFRRVVDHDCGAQLSAALEVLRRPGDSLQDRLLNACDQWSHAADLTGVGTSFADETMRDYEARFEQALAHALANSPMALICKNIGVKTEDAARALHATGRGLKQAVSSRSEFRTAMAVAVQMFCAPLSQQSHKE